MRENERMGHDSNYREMERVFQRDGERVSDGQRKNEGRFDRRERWRERR